MKVAAVQIVVGVLGTVFKNQEKNEELGLAEELKAFRTQY